MLKTKCILAPMDVDDGRRISVMSRHTLNDGITPHPLINQDSFNFWKNILAPPDDLVGDWYKGRIQGNTLDERFAQFEERYLDYLKQNKISKEVEKLAYESLTQNITLLCIEDSPKYCHRRLLAQECQIYEPSLELLLK